ncbi:MAG: hypothetical protein L0H31_01655 [Nocardioidaceae bacterium]|nr:hypothetical protein [Nocardioidaceae bacterium]
MVDIATLGRTSDWSRVRAVVAGFDTSGAAAVDNLLHLGAEVHALAESADAAVLERADLLEVLGARIDIHAGATDRLPPQSDVLVLSPQVVDGAPIVAAAAERGVPVWGEVELAWRLRDPSRPAPWLCVAGQRRDVAGMLTAILTAAGLRAACAGTSDLPLTEAVMDPDPYDALAVVLSAAQLRRAGPMAARSAVVLNDEPGLGRVFEGVSEVCVYASAEPGTELLVREADVVEGARAIGVTLAVPEVSMLGVVDDLLVDRAFIEQRATSAAELCTLQDLPTQDPQTVIEALAATALARSHGVGQAACREGLRAFGRR